MDKSQLFELYEILALILPGAVILYGIGKLFPQLMFFSNTTFSFGDFGIFVLIAYVTGHIVQVFGGIVENVWRSLRGDPLHWLMEGKKQVIFTYQVTELEDKIAKRLGI